MVKKSFETKIIDGGRITVPEVYRDALKLKKGSRVKITIENAKV